MVSRAPDRWALCRFESGRGSGNNQPTTKEGCQCQDWT
nr:MAG TPA: hypothetical protein [Caudoviricetes sp.]